ncbi:MAG TPA: hypothetical protein VIO61_00475 [Anaerolineaceae bacterium]
MIDERVAKLLDFDDSDLYANQNGLLTEKQEKRLVRTEKGANLFLVVIALVFFSGGVIPIVILWLTGAFAKMGWASLAFAAFPIVFVPVGMEFLKIALARLEYTVETFEGPVKVVVKQGTPPTAELRCGGRVFTVDPALKNLISPDDIYAVYYATGDKLLSLERLLSGERS